MRFGEWIRQKRIDLRLNANECASRANMSPTQWSRWETGEVRRKSGEPSQPRKETMEAIANALEVDMSEVMEAAGLTRHADPDIRLAKRLNPIINKAAPGERDGIEEKLIQMARILVSTAA